MMVDDMSIQFKATNCAQCTFANRKGSPIELHRSIGEGPAFMTGQTTQQAVVLRRGRDRSSYMNST